MPCPWAVNPILLSFDQSIRMFMHIKCPDLLANVKGYQSQSPVALTQLTWFPRVSLLSLFHPPHPLPPLPTPGAPWNKAGHLNEQGTKDVGHSLNEWGSEGMSECWQTWKVSNYSWSGGWRGGAQRKWEKVSWRILNVQVVKLQKSLKSIKLVSTQIQNMHAQTSNYTRFFEELVPSISALLTQDIRLVSSTLPSSLSIQERERGLSFWPTRLTNQWEGTLLL